ncbi:DUF3800 domain-containing protein [Patescibacteria group bacterium]|nr:DUF3800 domain-containing protein [Patescibacteria group bacterium]
MSNHMPENIYNIYCDESSIENKENQFMIIGALFLVREKKEKLREELKKLKLKYKFNGEIKWNKVSNRFLSFYKALVDLFISFNDELQFHCIKIDRNKVNFELYHHNDLEEGFYKFYYQLLKNKFKQDCSYYIFLDYKPTKSKKRVFILENYLRYRIANYSNSKIRKIQEYSSTQNTFIQIADLFSGAVNYDNNFVIQNSKTKKEFVKYLSDKIKKQNLKFCSLPSENKFNIFCIKPVGNKD